MRLLPPRSLFWHGACQFPAKQAPRSRGMSPWGHFGWGGPCKQPWTDRPPSWPAASSLIVRFLIYEWLSVDPVAVAMGAHDRVLGFAMRPAVVKSGTSERCGLPFGFYSIWATPSSTRRRRPSAVFSDWSRRSRDARRCCAFFIAVKKPPLLLPWGRHHGYWRVQNRRKC
jgi:hypothetical protein